MHNVAQLYGREMRFGSELLIRSWFFRDCHMEISQTAANQFDIAFRPRLRSLNDCLYIRFESRPRWRWKHQFAGNSTVASRRLDAEKHISWSQLIGRQCGFLEHDRCRQQLYLKEIRLRLRLLKNKGDNLIYKKLFNF